MPNKRTELGHDTGEPAPEEPERDEQGHVKGKSEEPELLDDETAAKKRKR